MRNVPRADVKMLGEFVEGERLREMFVNIIMYAVGELVFGVAVLDGALFVNDASDCDEECAQQVVGDFHFRFVGVDGKLVHGLQEMTDRVKMFAGLDQREMPFREQRIFRQVGEFDFCRRAAVDFEMLVGGRFLVVQDVTVHDEEIACFGISLVQEV